MTTSLALCARIARNELVAAECTSLTGAAPDADGVATDPAFDAIERSAYVRCGMRVIARAATFDGLVDAVRQASFAGDDFRIEVHDPRARLALSGHHVAVALADVMPFAPDLDRPRHRFVVVARSAEFAFGEICAETARSYRAHDAKPWSTSSSIDARFSRALVNLVPEARSVADPCCGAGSIVLEAASLGLEASGADWKPAMVGMTRENLAHFGYSAAVRQADSRQIELRADAVVTDLPYGHAIQTDEGTVRAILERSAEGARRGVFVAPHDITEWLSTAGFDDLAVHTVEKRAGFTRWVHVGESRYRRSGEERRRGPQVA